jgi:putative DNA methylase
LIASPHRFAGGADEAKTFFEQGLGRAFATIRQLQHEEYPLTVYYAFKQAESGDEAEKTTNGMASVASTGWETMLEGLLRPTFMVTGTWPMRSERGARMRSIDSNALASSIVLVCRPRTEDAPIASRREFTAALRRELPAALRKLQQGNIAPVDLAQAAIGPGMAVFSRYAKVLEADGRPMAVRTALQLINQELDAFFSAQEGELDDDSRFCVAWFDQFGMREAPFGEADVLARAKNTSVGGLEQAGVLLARGGKVRLLRRDEYPADWDPRADRRLCTWECTQQLIRRLERDGEAGAAALVALLGGARAEAARELAYRLYAICERKRWAEEALPYNGLVVSWPAIQARVAEQPLAPSQPRML